MDNEKERELALQRVSEFRAEYADRLERALRYTFGMSPITMMVRHRIYWDEAGELGVTIPSSLSGENRRRFIEVVDTIYHELREEFAIGSYPLGYEQKNDPVTVISLNSSSPDTAPRFGERILLLVLRTKEERANIPGDLEEEFKEIAAKHGARYAKLWYYKQVAASAWPLVRKAAGLGIMAWVEEWIRRRV